MPAVATWQQRPQTDCPASCRPSHNPPTPFPHPTSPHPPTARLAFRYVWARKDAPGKNGAGDVLAVGPGDIDSTTSFLQVGCSA